MRINYLLKNHRCLLVALLLLIKSSLFAQTNLIPNPSFELYDTCPYSASQIYFATPWKAPPVNSTDYYNSCDMLYLGVPGILQGGYQYPKTGNAYATLRPAGGGDYKEYLQVKMNDTLEAGKCYHVSFYINLFNKSIRAVNSIGAYLSSQPDTLFTIWLAQPTILNYSPQILKYNNPVLTDTANWVNVEGIYTAIGNENYLTIGCFVLNASLRDSTVNSNGSEGPYYNIDDVSVIEATPSYIAQELKMQDTALIKGDTLLIGGEVVSGIHYNWYVNNAWIDSTGQLKVHPTTTTTYVRTITWCGNTIYDTMIVRVNGVGIKNVNEFGSLPIYPNPASATINIVLSKENRSLNYSIKLNNYAGVEVMNKKFTGSSTIINVSSLVSGIYLITVDDGTNIERRKISIIH